MKRDVGGDMVEDQLLKDIERVAEEEYWSLGGWLCWGFGLF